MKLRVIVLNYRTPVMAVDAVNSLRSVSLTDIDLEVVVVDNASGDGSLQIFSEELHQAKFSFPVHIIDAGGNRGFAHGNNIALTGAAPVHTSGLATSQPAWAPCDIVWLLNPDAYLLPGQNVEAMLRWFVDDPKRGILGTAVVNADGSVRPSAFRFPGVLSELESALGIGMVSRLLQSRVVAMKPPPRACEVDWVSGASFLIRSTVIESVGPLDDGYFMYFEETDYCMAAARKGYQTWYWPDVQIVHLVGQASGVTGDQRRFKRRPTYWFDSRRRYFSKNHGTATYHVASLVWLCFYPIGRVWAFLRGRRLEDPPKLWWDFFRNYVGLMK